jgi:hypothetical protein
VWLLIATRMDLLEAGWLDPHALAIEKPEHT